MAVPLPTIQSDTWLAAMIFLPITLILKGKAEKAYTHPATKGVRQEEFSKKSDKKSDRSIKKRDQQLRPQESRKRQKSDRTLFADLLCGTLIFEPVGSDVVRELALEPAMLQRLDCNNCRVSEVQKTAHAWEDLGGVHHGIVSQIVTWPASPSTLHLTSLNTISRYLLDMDWAKTFVMDSQDASIQNAGSQSSSSGDPYAWY